jgi:cytochrome oxidase Cu insertion factor (SCO1/SenC/PrrC family)
VVALALAGVCWAAARIGGAAIGVPEAHRASDVPLVSTDGRQVRLADGPRIVVFGYVGCAERCPLTLEALSRTAQARPGRFARITFIDCDPWMDSRDLVRRYVRHFPGVQGVTGDARALVANEVALGMWPVARREDVAAHDTRIFVLDGKGILIAALAPERSSDELASRVGAVLATVKHVR